MLNLIDKDGNLIKDSISNLNTRVGNANQKVSIVSVMGNQSSGKSLFVLL
jgi:hypothetical protein